MDWQNREENNRNLLVKYIIPQRRCVYFWHTKLCKDTKKVEEKKNKQKRRFTLNHKCVCVCGIFKIPRLLSLSHCSVRSKLS